MARITTSTLLLITMFFPVQAAYGQEEIGVRRAAYNALFEIKNPQERIAAEMRYNYLGHENQDSNRASNFENVKAVASSFPDQIYRTEFVFQRGLSSSEVEQLLIAGDFEYVEQLTAFVVKKNGRVVTIGFKNYEIWAGSPREVLDHIIAELYQQSKVAEDAGLPQNELHKLVLSTLSKPDLMRFYKIEAHTSAAVVELLRSSNANDLAFVGMHEVQKQIIRIPQSDKHQIPATLEDSGGEALRGGFQNAQPSLGVQIETALDSAVAFGTDVVRLVFDFVVPSAYANQICGPTVGNHCPPEHHFAPGSGLHAGSWSPTYMGPSYPNAGWGTMNILVSFDSSSEIQAYRDATKPDCFPIFNPLNGRARCTIIPGGGEASNVIYVQEPNDFENSVRMVDHECDLSIRTGTASDFLYFDCLHPASFFTVLPNTAYVGNTLSDDGDEFILEVGTQSGENLNTEFYATTVNWIGHQFNSIHTGDEGTLDYQVNTILPDQIPFSGPGLEEFLINYVDDLTWCWNLPVCP